MQIAIPSFKTKHFEKPFFKSYEPFRRWDGIHSASIPGKETIYVWDTIKIVLEKISVAKKSMFAYEMNRE